jgi:hypothetical protein
MELVYGYATNYLIGVIIRKEALTFRSFASATSLWGEQVKLPTQNTSSGFYKILSKWQF